AAAADGAVGVGGQLREGERVDGGTAIGDVAVPSGAVTDGQVWVVALLAELGMVKSRNEARRLVADGAVRLDGERCATVDHTWALAELDGRVLSVGRRTPVRLRASGAPA